MAQLGYCSCHNTKWRFVFWIHADPSDSQNIFLQVYLPTISGHVLDKMVQTLQAFLDFCYIVCQNVLDSTSLQQLDNALKHFHKYWTVFQECGVCPSRFSLPHQHSLVHYAHMIREFGAPNGLCSSITESKHIKAVKEPWRCSNRYEALGQMLLTNQWLDKIAASHADFTAQGMLDSNVLQTIMSMRQDRKLYFILYFHYKSHHPPGRRATSPANPS